MFDYINKILTYPPQAPQLTIGKSRDDLDIKAGIYPKDMNPDNKNISLIGGCHADEPVGPRLLRKLCSFMAGLDNNHPIFENYNWYIIPHANPDSEKINQQWYDDEEQLFDLVKYMKYAFREKPGDDVEFSFPRHKDCNGQRTECKAIYDFWRQVNRPFHLHASLHGMSIASGPWFLIDRSWIDRSDNIQSSCANEVTKMGYELHDIDRQGEKGFTRIAKGFCTRPDSKAMRQHFLELNEHDMADKFYHSSMEAIREISQNDCLTLVSEMPLFTVPQLDSIKWPNEQWLQWKSLINNWKIQLSGHCDEDLIHKEIKKSIFKPMPIDDQMRLQWRFITAGLSAI